MKDYTIQTMIREHYLKEWGNDPNVTLEGMFSTLEAEAYDTLEELEEDRRVLEEKWNDYFRSGCWLGIRPANSPPLAVSTTESERMVIAPNKELAFLRGLFPCHTDCRLRPHSVLSRCGGYTTTYEEMKQKEEEIWRGIFDQCRQIYRSIHGRDPVEGLPPIRWCDIARKYVDDPNGYAVHVVEET